MGAGGDTVSINPCTDCSAPIKSGTVANPDIDEASGLVASAVHPGVFYVHNDSGDSPRIFAIDRTGADLNYWDIVNAKAVDWEDMAAGPCDEGRCLFIADFGDNSEKRDDYVIYRLKEPAVVGGSSTQLSAQAFPFEYPDGSHNAEALIADPKTGQLYVLTKVSSGASTLYRFPAQLDPDQTAVLSKVGSFKPPQGVTLITAADAHQNGVLVRTYTQLYYFRYVNSDIVASLATTPCLVPKAFEIQGETVAWSMDGTAYYTVSEGKSVPVNEFLCTMP